MKKILLLCLTLAVLYLSLAGCSGNSTNNTNNGNGSNSLAQEPQSVGGDNAEKSVKDGGAKSYTATENDLTTIVSTKNSENAQTVVYENVEMRRYEGEAGHPYIYDSKTNNVDKTITGFERGMLAYDKDGQPLKIDWYTLDRDLEQTYDYLCKSSSELLPDQTNDEPGGWSLNYWGNDPSVIEIAYVLYCDKEITFEDETVWTNPDFDEWLETYAGKTIDTKVLESYYPYVQKIIG